MSKKPGAVHREQDQKGIGALLNAFAEATPAQMPLEMWLARERISSHGKWDLSDYLKSPALYVALRAWVHSKTQDGRDLVQDWFAHPENYRGQRQRLYCDLVGNLRSAFRDPRREWQFYADEVFAFHTSGHRQAWDALADIQVLAQVAGLRGFVLLFDEFEDVIQNLNRRNLQEAAFLNLFRFFDGDRFPGMSYFAVTPDFVGKCKIQLIERGVYDFDYGRFDRLPYFEMEPIECSEFADLAARIRTVYGIAYDVDAGRLFPDGEMNQIVEKLWTVRSPDRVRRSIQGIVEALDGRLDQLLNHDRASGDLSVVSDYAVAGKTSRRLGNVTGEIFIDGIVKALDDRPGQRELMPIELSTEVGRAFYSGFSALRPAQRESVNPVVEGDDVLVLAGTGSGKTEAVLAPLVQRWLPAMRREPGCSIIYVTPTRALANDLLRRIEPSMDSLGLRVGVRHGDRNDLCRTKKPELLITTPESLDVLLTSRNEALRSVRGVVLDEVHLIYNTQRGCQLGILLRRLEGFTGTSLQVVGLSATIAAPTHIWRFFRPGQRVVAVRDEQAKPLDAYIRDIPSDQALVDLIDGLSAGARVKDPAVCKCPP